MIQSSIPDAATQRVLSHAENVALSQRRWAKILAQYRDPKPIRSLFELAVTIVPFIALWALAWAAYQVSVFLCLIAAIPAAGFLVRIFLIQHDCGHGSFFRSKVLNDWIGRALGVLTCTPYDYWRRTHAIHHNTHGNLEERGIGDIDTLTVNEYLALSRLGRLKYRLYRNPIVMFGIGPAYVFLLKQRLPFGLMRGEGWTPWLGTMATNAGIALFAGIMIWLVGLWPFLAVQLPITVAAATIGVWLFYVQHQFEDTVWEHEAEWDHQNAALLGSSYYDLPTALRWLTANIGIHHIHHMNARIPYYRLSEVLRDYPELKTLGRITVWESLKCARLTLWDEANRRLVGFRDVKKPA